MSEGIQIRADIGANWIAANPVLDAAEPALELDTGRLKYGNGTTPWITLPYSDFFKIVNKTADYTTTFRDRFLRGSSSSAFTITLHVATGSGQRLTIKNTEVGILTINPYSGQTIDGLSSIALSVNQYTTLLDASSSGWEAV
jgi:hypothetical protein